MCREDFKYILVYLEVCYVILITSCFKYLYLCHFFPFSPQNCFLWHAGQNILKTVQAIHLKFLGIFYSYQNYDLSGADSFQTTKIFNDIRKTFEKIFCSHSNVPLWILGCKKKYAARKSLFYYTKITCQKFSFERFHNLEIFWSTWRYLLSFLEDFGWLPWQRCTISNFYDTFKNVSMCTLYLDTSHWLECPSKIMGM